MPGKRIPDYSYAGYKYGEAAIPSVPEVLRLSPASGDNTARIQQALDQHHRGRGVGAPLKPSS